MLSLCVAIVVFMSFVMALGWAWQRHAKNGGWTDVFWSFGSGASCVAAALWPLGVAAPLWRQLMCAGLAGAWSLRLGAFLWRRVANKPEDRRYAQMRSEWKDGFQKRMFWFLQIQAPVGAILAMAVLLASRNPRHGLQITDIAGIVVFFGSLIGETVTDAQMAGFIRNSESRQRVCDVGLWRWTRHPNYFFEWLIWWTWPLIAFDPTGQHPWAAPAALAAPILMFWLLTRVSGVPPLEAALLQSKGDAYRDYQRRTPAFFPRRPSDRRIQQCLPPA